MDMRTLRGAASVGFMRSLWAKVRHDDVLNGAAALAFYMTLAIFPAMIVVMAVIPYLPIEQVDQALMQLLRQALPGHAADLFSDVVQDITTEQRGGLLSAGLAGSLWITSTGMYAVMRQLNRTYGVRESRGFLRGRLTALGLSLLFGVLVIGGFSLIVLGDRLQDWLVVRRATCRTRPWRRLRPTGARGDGAAPGPVHAGVSGGPAARRSAPASRQSHAAGFR